jgi:hypothetical protein
MTAPTGVDQCPAVAVVEVAEGAGHLRRVARSRPLVVIKG